MDDNMTIINDGYTYTNADMSDPPCLTLDMILDAYKKLEQLRPVVYYRTSEYVPKTDANGEPFTLTMPVDMLHVSFPSPPVALKERLVTYIHPSNLAEFIREGVQMGYKVLPCDESRD